MGGKEGSEEASSQKAVIRDRITDILISNTIVRPDPVFHLELDHFIADFSDNEGATKRLADLPEWQNATTVFITPDNSTERLRQAAIKNGKRLIVTTYGIVRGAVLIEPGMVPRGQEEYAATLVGLERFGKPLTTVPDVQTAGAVDVMVTGALAISSAHGGRTGKGAGWFDAEWAMWNAMGVAKPETPIIGIIHDAQVVDDAFALDPWDAHTTIIVTPTQVIRPPVLSQPQGIFWVAMDPQWRDRIPLMKELYNLRRQPDLT